MLLGRRRATAAALVAMALLAAACGGSSGESGASSPSESVSVSNSQAPSSEPTATATAASPTPAPTPTPVPLPDLPVGTLAKVVPSSVNVRTEPSASAPQVTDVTDTALSVAAGQDVLVLGSPLWHEGYWWLLVGVPQSSGLYAAPIPVGWVARGTATEEWLVADDAPCPQPTVTVLGELSGIQRVGCYGSSSLTFDAHVAALPPDAGLGGVCGVLDPYPAWLMCDNVNYNWVNADGGPDWVLQLHFDPGTGLTATGLAGEGTIGPPVRIVGHFDDPASTGCIQGDGPTTLEAQSQRLTCSAKFVVESVEYLS
jgi:hypothetical protein